jgi:serine/threonine protein kinase
MPLAPSTRLGPYEILSAIGAGGMGEVYRARDTTLERDVAIKVLPDAFAHDAERMARFAPKPLFDARFGNRPFDISPDGRRFLLANSLEDAGHMPMTVVVNWTGEVKR